MNTCLRNRTLVLLAAGEGTTKQRTHLKSCLTCASRYQHLTRDLAVIERTLRTTPLPSVLSQRAPLAYRQWLPLAAVFAAALVLIWGGFWLRPSSRLAASRATPHEDVSLFWQNEMSPALFVMVERPIVAVPAPVSNAVYLQAALDGGWPCEWQGAFSSPICEIHPFPLLLGE